jgi:uncharacterized protein
VALDLTKRRRWLIGVVHLLPTPGSPRGVSMLRLLERARADARALRAGGCHALIVENFGDAPFHKERVPAETIAALALALAEVRELAGELPVGVNVLRNDARAALGLCAAAGADFLRVNVHTGAMLTDQGLVEGRAADTLRERARLCPRAALLADVHVKHAAVLGGETLEDAAADAWERGGADALIVSGRGTCRARGSWSVPAWISTTRASCSSTPTARSSARLSSAAAGPARRSMRAESRPWRACCVASCAPSTRVGPVQAAPTSLATAHQYTSTQHCWLVVFHLTRPLSDQVPAMPRSKAVSIA